MVGSFVRGPDAPPGARARMEARTMKLSALPVVATAILTLPAHAQPDPFARPLPAAAGTEAVGRYLHDLGFAPKALSSDVYQVTVDRDRWPVHVMLSLSTDGRRVWLESKFAPIEDPDKVPPQAWKRLLEANEKIGPAHFAFEKNDRRIHLYKSFDSIGLSASRLKAELEHFDQTVRKTKDYWRADNFKPVIASSDTGPDPGRAAVPTAKRTGKLPTSPTEPAAESLANPPPGSERLQGEWTVTDIQVNGRKTPESVLKDRGAGMTVSAATLGFTLPNGKPGISAKMTAELRIGPGHERTVAVKFPATLALMIQAPGTPQIESIDLVDDDGAEHGIYTIDADTLTVCFAAPGDSRPTELKSTEQPKTTLIVFKKAK
jgi:uncharacterized protein (TIGR03067 family)